jgi:hypothetical protein
VTEADPAASLLGAAGVASSGVWGLIRDRRGILLGQGAHVLFFGANFALIGAYTGSAMCALSHVQLSVATSPRSQLSTVALTGRAAARRAG